MEKNRKSTPSSSPERLGGMKEFKSVFKSKTDEVGKSYEKNKIADENTLKTQKNGEVVKITKALLWKLFKIAYRLAHQKEFNETPDALANVAPIIEYFAQDLTFFRRERLITKIKGVSLIPGFDKGLLIIGGYGNAKTTVIEALGLLFEYYSMPMRFKNYKAHDLVTEFERIGADPTYRESSRYQFYERLTKVKGLYIDDVKKERLASNFGKVNLIRDILEKRYDQKSVKTYITCNYREGDAFGDMADALEEFGDLYGGHIYDRLFEIFNIIEFKGATFRR